MKIHQLSVAEALASVRGQPDGLSSAGGAAPPGRVRPEIGSARSSRIPLPARLARGVFSFLLADSLGGRRAGLRGQRAIRGQGMLKVRISIVAVILVSGSFSFWQEYRVAVARFAQPAAAAAGAGAARRRACGAPAEQLVPATSC